MDERNKLDINVCYRKLFEMLADRSSMSKMINTLAEYTGAAITIVDIGGNTLAASGVAGDDEKSSAFVELLPQYFEAKKAHERNWIDVHDDHTYRIIGEIEVKGNVEGFCFMTISSGEEQKIVYEQINGMLCQTVGMLMERQWYKVHYHTSTLRRMIARSLFESDEENILKMREAQELFDTYVKAPFLMTTIVLNEYNVLKMQNAGNKISDVYHNTFIHFKDQRMYILFSDVHSEAVKATLFELINEICEKYDFVAGMSEVFDDVELLSEMKFMLSKAIEIGRVLEPEKRVHMEFDYYVQIVCSCAVSKIGHARYQEDALQRLKKEDELRGTGFYNTLKEYLLCGNNVSMTSKKLYIHRNTMIYRLGKINEILGVDINDPSVSKCLMLSIILQEHEYKISN